MSVRKLRKLAIFIFLASQGVQKSDENIEKTGLAA